MITLTEEERLALGLPLEGEVSVNSYNQVAHQINSELLRFAGATGYAFNADGSIQSTTPEGITLEFAEANYLAYPKFHGRPYSDDKTLNSATSSLIQEAFVLHFSTAGTPYQTIFDKIITQVVSGEKAIEWASWLLVREAIIQEKITYKTTTPWGV